MIGKLATVVLAVGASLGGLYGGTTMALNASDGSAVASGTMVDGGILRTELSATPLVVGSSIYGYIIGRYVITYDAKITGERQLPLETLVIHAVNRFFYDNAAQAFWFDGPLDVNGIAQGLQASINETAGVPIVTALAIRQLDYLQSPEIRQPVISFDR